MLDLHIQGKYHVSILGLNIECSSSHELFLRQPEIMLSKVLEKFNAIC